LSGCDVEYSDADQLVPLTATVTSAAGSVPGAVTFAVQTAANASVGTSVTGSIVNGTATASYVLPGGTIAQALTITATYTGSTNFGGGAGTATLNVGCPLITVSPIALTFLRLASRSRRCSESDDERDVRSDGRVA
jgi:hypothetical protein